MIWMREIAGESVTIETREIVRMNGERVCVCVSEIKRERERERGGSSLELG